jgi:hypothetical protein
MVWVSKQPTAANNNDDSQTPRIFQILHDAPRRSRAAIHTSPELLERQKQKNADSEIHAGMSLVWAL